MARKDLLGRRGRKPWDLEPLAPEQWQRLKDLKDVNGCDGCLDGTYHVAWCTRVSENDEIARRLSGEGE